VSSQLIADVISHDGGTEHISTKISGTNKDDLCPKRTLSSVILNAAGRFSTYRKCIIAVEWVELPNAAIFGESWWGGMCESSTPHQDAQIQH
jgi:hypothetical protein